MTAHDPRDADIDIPVDAAARHNTTGGTATRQRRVFLGVGQRGEHRPRTFTHPSVIDGIKAGADWVDPETDPTRIDWASRQARAAIPFNVVDGRPVNPCEQTAIRYGRNECGHWGEALAADALVFATDPHGRRWIIMVERVDGHGWALPGGHVDDGEDPLGAAIRELGEETNPELPEWFFGRRRWQVSPPRYVPDPRSSDEAWMVTVLARVDLGAWLTRPKLTAGDDATRAEWVRADSYEALTGYLASEYGGKVFAAHRDMLAEVLDGAGR